MGADLQSGKARNAGRRSASVVIRAAKVVAAVGADQLAFVAGQAVGAGWADLAMVVDGAFLIRRADRTVL